MQIDIKNFYYIIIMIIMLFPIWAIGPNLIKVPKDVLRVTVCVSTV